MPYRFSNDLFALTNALFGTLKIKQAIKKIEYQAFKRAHGVSQQLFGDKPEY